MCKNLVKKFIYINLSKLLQNAVIFVYILYVVCKNLVKKFIYINFLMMSLQTKNSIFLVCSDIIKNLN